MATHMWCTDQHRSNSMRGQQQVAAARCSGMQVFMSAAVSQLAISTLASWRIVLARVDSAYFDLSGLTCVEALDGVAMHSAKEAFIDGL